ncbi:MAG: GNAT family N-acetyltransferase [Vampirovibrio sp.]|nr:GNAT family N-acetyltransferase [Vampirovibrio sp.]
MVTGPITRGVAKSNHLGQQALNHTPPESWQNAGQDPFKEYGLTPSFAEEKDLPAVLQLEAAEDVQGLIDLLTPQGKVDRANLLSQLFQDESEIQAHKSLIQEVSEEPSILAKVPDRIQQIPGFNRILPAIRTSFLNNPRGALIVLKDKADEVIAMEGIHQLQLTHHSDIEKGIYDTIDPQHALLSSSRVKPSHTRRKIGEALHRTAIASTREHFGASHVWSLTRKNSPSDKINEKLGFQPLQESTRFEEPTNLTPQVIEKLLANYNDIDHHLSWLETSNID